MRFCLSTGLVIPIALTALLSLSTCFGGGDGWTHDVDAALKQAKAEGKDILIDFTGSDWCGWCIRLNEEVFSQKEFLPAVTKSFVLVELDFPRGKQQSAEIKKQNQEWQAKFQVQGFPTILLMDADGRPFAQTGYQAGGAEKYLAHLSELKGIREKRDEALADAEKAKGAERARLLDTALTALSGSNLQPGVILAAYGNLTEEILKADANDEAGLKSKYASISRQTKIRSLLEKKDFKGAIAACDETLKDDKPSGQLAQDTYLLRSECNFYAGQKEAARSDLDLALKAAPEGEKVKLIQTIITRVFDAK
ncbi:MAG: thioredoxin family protein [Planctomycetota bacterium]|nr:thioredoxin family protein [Planctomycetota bacterium]MDA1140652.1 thioredoxin family protein [Planctomycetota bacterium]